MANSFRMFSLGFLLILVDFTVLGFDILPDILGYILFAIALNALFNHNDSFVKARYFNLILIVYSILYMLIPGKSGNSVLSFNLILDFIHFLLNLLVVYNLFNGIKDLSRTKAKQHIYNESELRWKQYLMLHIASFISLILMPIPFLFVVYILAVLVLIILYLIKVMSFMNRCGEQL